MQESTPPQLLSDLTSGSEVSRRGFIGRVPLLAVAAAACSRAEPDAETTVDTAATQDPRRGGGAINSNSRLDTAIVKHPHGIEPGAIDPATIPYRRYDPALPPVSTERTTRVHWRAREVPVRISKSQVVHAWTFEGDVPGPILHVRQGDTVEFTLTNEGNAAQIDPKVAFRSVLKGDSITFTFKPRHAGAFMYHCGTAPVLLHIGAGMYGAIIVDPPEPLPKAKEFVLVQSEYYVSAFEGGVARFDYGKMANTMPDFVTFNGRPDQYIAEPIHVKRGDRVRFYVVCAGPTHPCSFHVVGEQFDTVYVGAPPNNPLRGVQTFAVPPGGGMIFDMIADIPGEFPFVNHGFGHGQKGAIGFLVVDE